MKLHQVFLRVALCLSMAQLTFGQTATEATPTQPRLVRFGGTATDPNGGPLSGVVGVTFALYSEQTGGAPLWQETQNATADSNGHYTALLGATRPEGLPVDLFTGEQAHWVGVQVEGQAEQARVLLVSVPYALKANDADTLGGRPASAYLLAGSSSSVPEVPAGVVQSAQPATVSANAHAAARPDLVSGTLGYIPYFYDASSDLGNSMMYQSGGHIGIGTTSPGQLLTLQTGGTGYTFLENLYGSVDPGNGATRLQVGNPVSSLMLTAYGSKSPGILGGSAGVVSLAGPLLVGNAAANAPLYLYAGNAYTAPQFTLTSTGKVGIGTQTPAATLEVNGNAQVDGNLTLSGSIWSPVGTFAPAGPIFQAPNNGTGNLSVGYGSLPPTTTGSVDVAVGYFALAANTTGSSNTAIGFEALQSNNTGGVNTAIGSSALFFNTTGSSNTASGGGALQSNATGSYNTADGNSALYSNTIGGYNTAIGFEALQLNTTGSENAAIGNAALELNTTGSSNTAIGTVALGQNSAGVGNTAIGSGALWAITTGSNNTAIGQNAGVYSNPGNNNNIYIGNAGIYTDSDVMRIGTAGQQAYTYIAGIYGNTTSVNNAVEVVIDSNGNLGTTSSSRRYKEDIQDMADASSGLLRLRPVTFRYKKPYSDGSQPVQYGLIAEEVAEVYPDLVARSADGQIETVRYQVLGSMLLNELQKQNTTIAAQKEQIQEQGQMAQAQAQQIRSLEERLATMESALQKISLGGPSR
jgi:hypothetical protein